MKMGADIKLIIIINNIILFIYFFRMINNTNKLVT